MIKLSRLALVTLFGLMIPALFTVPAHAEVITNDKTPIAMVVPIFDDDLGFIEMVSITGYIHNLESTTLDVGDGMHWTLHYNYAGVIGIGMSSGDTYRMTGTSVMRYNVKHFTYPYEFTYESYQNFISLGSGNNYVVKIHIHITINANGEMTANFGL